MTNNEIIRELHKDIIKLALDRGYVWEKRGENEFVSSGMINPIVFLTKYIDEDSSEVIESKIHTNGYTIGYLFTVELDCNADVARMFNAIKERHHDLMQHTVIERLRIAKSELEFKAREGDAL